VSARAEHAGDSPDLEQNHHSSAELAPDSAQSGEQEQFKISDLCTYQAEAAQVAGFAEDRELRKQNGSRI
jgi:hypothetical protein